MVWICASVCTLIAGTLAAFAASPAPAATLKAQSSIIKLQLSASHLRVAPQSANGTATSSNPDVTFYAIAAAEDPFTLTRTSKTIYAQAKIVDTLDVTACALGVDLEIYNGYAGQWQTAAHTPMTWGPCPVGRTVTASYNCRYDPYTQWGYRTHLWVQAEQGPYYAPMAQAFSTNNVLYWCD